MDAILVVNAGSSSVKFQIFDQRASGDPQRLIKGQFDGIGTRPRLRAEARDGKTLIDKTYSPQEIADVATAIGAAGNWLREIDRGRRARVTDPVLLRHLLWAGLDRGLPVQFHTGFGDPDCDLRRSNPLWLRGFLERCEPRGVPVMLLHCYPYHRQAGALAQAYPHVYLDVGMALHYVGARASAVLAESLELAPFGKVLFSSDAAGPAESALARKIRFFASIFPASRSGTTRICALPATGD